MKSNFSLVQYVKEKKLHSVSIEEFKNLLSQMSVADFFDLKHEFKDDTCCEQSFFNICLNTQNTYYLLEFLLLEHVKKENKKGFFSQFFKSSTLEDILDTILSGDIIHYKIKDEFTLFDYLINYEKTLNLYQANHPTAQSLFIIFMLSYMEKKENFAYDFYDLYQSLILKETDKLSPSLKQEFDFFFNQFQNLQNQPIEKVKSDYGYLMKQYLMEQSFDYGALSFAEYPKRAIWFYPMYKTLDYFIKYETKKNPTVNSHIPQIISYSQGFLDLYYTNRDVFVDYQQFHHYDVQKNKMKCTINAREYMQLGSSQTKHIFECLVLRSFESIYSQYAIENEKIFLDSTLSENIKTKRMKI